MAMFAYRDQIRDYTRHAIAGVPRAPEVDFRKGALGGLAFPVMKHPAAAAWDETGLVFASLFAVNRTGCDAKTILH